MTLEHEAPGQEATGQAAELVTAAVDAATTTTEATSAAAATTPTPDLAALLAQADRATLKAIAKEHPVLREVIEAEVTGRAGRTIQQEREQIAAQARADAYAQWQAVQDAKAADERLEAMSDEELGQFYRENKRSAKLREQVAFEAETRLRGQYEANMTSHLKELQESLLEDLPEDEREATREAIRQGKVPGFKALKQTAFEKTVAREREKAVAEARKDWETEQRSADRRGAPRPDIVEGTPTTSGLITQAIWDQNRHNREWRRENLEAIQRSLGKTITR